MGSIVETSSSISENVAANDPAISANHDKGCTSRTPKSFVQRTTEAELPRPPLTWRTFHTEIRWFNLAVVTVSPCLAFYGMFTTKPCKATMAFCVFYYVFNMIGITAGYHRLWSHRAYTASLPVQYLLAVAGAGSIQGSIKWWARGHRSHHRYTDTPLDPYNSQLGLLYTHILWMLVKPRIKPGPADISDLTANQVVRWQHKQYFYLIAIWGLLIPTVIPGLGWGDWWGGWWWAVWVRLVCVHHSVFSINSIAHYLGDTPYSDKHSPRDHLITAILTLGEGYHNFHHQFPSDYRNAVRWYQYDPTKWFIYLTSLLRLSTNLNRFRESEIQKCKLTMELKRVKNVQEDVHRRWGNDIPVERLPIWEWEEYKAKSKDRALTLVSGFILNVSSFLDEHPGGRAFLIAYVGKDATTAFNGGVYDHSDAAHNLLATMRVAILNGGLEIVKEAASPPWKRLQVVEVRSDSKRQESSDAGCLLSDVIGRDKP